MKHTIENNSSETITVVADLDRICIKQEFKGKLYGNNRYKVMILNRDEARRLLPILRRWLNGGLR